MTFIRKMIEQRRLKKEEIFKKGCSYSMIQLEEYIPYLKDDVSNIRTFKSELKDVLSDFRADLAMVDRFYQNFLHDLKKYEYTEKNTYFKNVKEYTQPKIEYMSDKKKQYRAEFESIYENFKRTTKGMNIPERNIMLKQMREVFDFDSTKYHKPEEFIIIR